MIVSLALSVAACHSAPSASGGTAVPDTHEAEPESAFRNEAPETDEPLYLDDNNMLVAGNPYGQKSDQGDAADPQVSGGGHAREADREAAGTSSLPAARGGKAASKVPAGGKMYVHTWGAQGEVWGTVVMSGSTGRGTIHDQDEHTYAIRVAYRNDHELVGTDQNGREYVFRL